MNVCVCVTHHVSPWGYPQVRSLTPRIARPLCVVCIAHNRSSLRWVNVKSALLPALSLLRRGQARERFALPLLPPRQQPRSRRRSLFQWTFILFGGEQVLRSGAKSQRIAVWRLLYHLQHSGQYLSRLQTDWLTHDVASVSMFDSGIPPMAIMAMRAERSTARA